MYARVLFVAQMRPSPVALACIRQCVERILADNLIDLEGFALCLPDELEESTLRIYHAIVCEEEVPEIVSSARHVRTIFCLKAEIEGGVVVRNRSDAPHVMEISTTAHPTWDRELGRQVKMAIQNGR